MSLVNGICYDGFPAPYDPSTANRTCIFSGSDAACDAMSPLWGDGFRSSTGSSCGASGPKCRNDLRTMRDMGVQTVRLYDWEPRNKHLKFLDACHWLGMSVLAPVSNYFLQREGFHQRTTHIPALIRSFADEAGDDYHPAVAGVIFGNELAGYGADECVKFTQDWATIEANQFPGFRKVRLGHPVQFDGFGTRFPCFGFWNKLLPPLQQDPGIKPRLFLAPQAYNDRAFLFENAEGSGSGWVDQAWQTYGTPIWFTEIGLDRTKADYEKVVIGQLEGVRDYCARHPDRLLGGCFFQFADKVWMPGTPEGSYGAFSHSGNILCTISYTAADFTHWDANCNNMLNVDVLARTKLYEAVRLVYAPKPR